MVASPSSTVARVLETRSASEIASLRAELDAICEEMRKAAADQRHLLQLVKAAHRASAANLISYLSLRRRDLRALQPRLAALGLSSLGRAEAQVMASIEAVQRALRALDRSDAAKPGASVGSLEQTMALAANTEALLGPAPSERRVRIMVTMPSEAARDYTLVHELVSAGMDCVRINCAHDDAETWAHMIRHLQRANKALGRSCQVAMDLAGPKLRTGPLVPGPAVVKVRPERDAFGNVISPARLWLTAQVGGQAAPSDAAASLPVARAWLARLKTGDFLKFTDARRARRVVKVVEVTPNGAWAQVSQTCYIVPGTKLERRRDKSTTAVGSLAPREEPIPVHSGDTLIITRDRTPGRAATRDERGRVLTPAHIGCTLSQVFDDVRSGDRIWIDDGRIGGLIEAVEADRVIVRIDRARLKGEKLRADKGINLPDSPLKLPALTPKDVKDLQFVVRNADLVALSFANTAADVELLQRHLKHLKGEKLGIILKIETRRGFESLPEMLFAAMRSERCGVMIARGDLAVECGFERLAELQEEILWICEAAHVPVIWATQVLETLAKEGVPSRAEITDAAMSERAECVMLNKGPHACAAVHVLDDILKRMEAHTTKKRAMLRELQLARHFLQKPRNPR